MACFFPFGEQQLNAMQCSELHNEQGMRRERIEGEGEERKKGRGRKEKEGGMRWRVGGGNGEKGMKGG